MNKALMATTALCLTTLSGCAITKDQYEAPSYKNNHSRAYNIAEAGGLITGIADTKVPRDNLERMTDTKAFGAAYVMSGYISPRMGSFSNWQGGALNAANWAFGPKQHGARNSLIAWMPATEAVSELDAQTKLLSHVKIAVESALADLGATFEVTLNKGGQFSYIYHSKEWGCPTWLNGGRELSNMCQIDIKVVEPRRGTAPGFITGVQGAGYSFTSGDGTEFNYLNVINGATSHAPEQAVYSKISEKLPAWAFLYLAPKKVKMGNGEKIQFPYLLEQGKPELFVFPS